MTGHRSLLEAPQGPQTVVSVRTGDSARGRLAELGIRPGTSVSVVRRTTGGGLVLDAEGSRVAVDRRTAAAVIVKAP